jgi:hypothetical protein
MFNFFDSQMNPFLGMMTLMGATADCAAPDSGDAESGNPIPDMDPEMKAGDMNPMQLMQKAFLLQMQLNQTMFMMPFAMMQSFGKMVSIGADGAGESGEDSGNPSGFKLGGVEIPPELLQMLLQIDMKPENLEKLQKALDFLFSAMPAAKEEEADGSGSDGQQ